MIKEDKSVDFYTTGNQPSEQDFARISEWIKKDKGKNSTYIPTKSEGEQVSLHSDTGKRKITV